MNPSKQQSGATLITALIMLIILTLLVLSGIRASSTNLRIAGNMQMQEEAVATAQQAVEQLISTNFTSAPASSAIAIDVDNNGSVDYTANINQPSCQATAPVVFGELNKDNAQDKPCFGSSAMGSFTAFGPGNTPTPSTNTWCFKQKWDIRANVTDNSTGASTTIHQGVYLRVKAGTSCI